MLVTTKILAIQQAYEFERNTKGVRVTKITGEHKETWEDVMETKNVIVCTAQSLLNGLLKREVFLNQFNLLVYFPFYLITSRFLMKLIIASKIIHIIEL
jgi:replicative superfamily II helicase